MSPEQIAELRRTRYNATVVGLRRAHSDLMILRLRPDFPLPRHKPGQYSTLGMGYWEPRFPGCQAEELAPGDETKLARRAYSISCSVLGDDGRLLDVEQADWLEFYIVLVRESDKPQAPALTPRLFLLREGDRLFVGEKITGHFTLDPVKPGDTVVFLATGTGEAPHNYLLWELLRRGHTGRILSACCVRYRRDLGYLAIQEELMRRYPNYTYLALTTREAETVKHKVYIQDLITSGQLEEQLSKPLDPATTHFYLCGNPKMIGVPSKNRDTGEFVYPQPPGVIEILERRGFQTDQPQAKIKGNLHFEEYW
ncbi:MAG TPA: ferredoxin--NADP reductase [Gemmataceae bacterium]|jgi:ferredoxin--NADP+ reductase|nr:ferredoxin--NADP reductase [Gemmataceae bacterium]